MSKTEITLCQARALRKGDEIKIAEDWHEVCAVHSVAERDITMVYFTRDSKTLFRSDELVRVDRKNK